MIRESIIKLSKKQNLTYQLSLIHISRRANKSIPDTCKKKKNGRSVFVWSHKKELTNMP